MGGQAVMEGVMMQGPDRVALAMRLPSGELYLKTDNEGLFDFSLEEFEAMGLTLLFSSRDFHKTPEAEGNIMTEYEANFSSQGMPIYCARVKF